MPIRKILRWIKRPSRIPRVATELYAQVDRALIGPMYGKIADAIVKKIKSGRVLDVGTGPGYLPIAITHRSKKLKAAGIDVNAALIEKAKKTAEAEGASTERCIFRKADAHKLPFGEGNLEMVVSVGLLHHLNAPIKSLDEIYRVLKDGGEAWIYDVCSDAGEKDIEDHVEMIDTKLRINKVNRILRGWIELMARREIAIDALSENEMTRIAEKSKFSDYHIGRSGVWARITLKK